LLFQTRQAAHSGLSQVADVAFQGTTCTDQVSHIQLVLCCCQSNIST